MKRIIFIALLAAAATFSCKYIFSQELETNNAAQASETSTSNSTMSPEEREFLAELQRQLELLAKEDSNNNNQENNDLPKASSAAE